MSTCAAYGRLPAFLFGWTEFTVARTGSMATLAAAFARYFVLLVRPTGAIDDRVWQAVAAVAAIALVTVVNVLGTRGEVHSRSPAPPSRSEASSCSCCCRSCWARARHATFSPSGQPFTQAHCSPE